MQVLERVGNIFQEYQAEDNMLVFGRVDVFAQFVRGLPELFFDWFVIAGCFGFCNN
jgi:hypothetical protein